MKNHRHLRNSPLLRFGIFALLAILFVPLIPALGSKATAGAVALAGLPMIGALRMEKEKDPGADAVGIPEAIKAIEDPTMTMGQRLSVALSALKGIDPTNQLATIQAKLTDAEASLVTKDGEITKLKADLEASQTRIGTLEADVKQADEARAATEKKNTELAAKEQDIHKRAEAMKKESLAALGFQSSDLPPQSSKHQSQEEENNTPEAKIRALKGDQRILAADHFRKHGKLPDFMLN